MNKEKLISRFKKRQTEVTLEDNINAEVEQLKDKLRKINEDYRMEAYQILKRIMILRKTQFPNYGFGELAKEKGIDMTYHQIAYIFTIEHLSKKTRKLIDEGKIKPSTAIYIVRQNIKFQEDENQDKVIQMYLDGKVTTTEISRLSNQILTGKLDLVSEEQIANKQLQSFQHILTNKLTLLRNKRMLFSDIKTIDYTINRCVAIIDELNKIKVEAEIRSKVEDDKN